MIPRRAALAAIAAATALAAWYGWQLFWFLTDDAFIAFRYVANSVAGHGYTWNPPPFRPVEGYTSFLWVVLLDAVWRASGVAPPVSANVLSLLFTWATLALVGAMVLRMELRAELARHRLALLALVLAAVVANRTVLAWSSSGLETAMFNCFAVAWAAGATALRPAGRPAWLLALSSCAALLYLSRPDGLLFAAATLAIFAVVRWRERGSPWRPQLAALAPLAVLPAHLLWRRAVYGAWLPNTYYAKHVAAWPRSGLAYLASFALEYALWFWLLAVAAAAAAWLRAAPPPLARLRAASAGELGAALAVAALAAHVGYYALVIGGDHFEYRVLSHLVFLLFPSALWLLDRSGLPPRAAVVALAAFAALSLPIPWAHWAVTRDLATRAETHVLAAPVAGHFPAPVRPYVAAFDALQRWLIEHRVGMRHQEHKVFYWLQAARYPPREQSLRAFDPVSRAGGWLTGRPTDGGATSFAVGRSPLPLLARNPVLAVGNVGVPGWALPGVHVLDLGGLNDAVIARNRDLRHEERFMAHDRQPPAGYRECFRPNVTAMLVRAEGGGTVLEKQDAAVLERWALPRDGSGRGGASARGADGARPVMLVLERDEPLTDAQIRDCESRDWY